MQADTWGEHQKAGGWRQGALRQWDAPESESEQRSTGVPLECWLRRRAGAAASCCRADPAGAQQLSSLPLQQS